MTIWFAPAWVVGYAGPVLASKRAMAMPHRKTCKRYNVPGDAHALTFSCFRRQPFLSKDRNVFEPMTAFEQIEYMHNNPVRRGLCARPEDWLWSSAADYAGIRSGPLRLDRESLPVMLGR